MSKFIEINSATTTTLAIANNRNVNNATNRRTSNKVDVSKISITNSSAHADGAVVTVFLDGVELDRTVNQLSQKLYLMKKILLVALIILM